MNRPNPDLHGNAPDKSAAALLIIDMINDLEFEDGAKLLEPAVAAATRIRALKERCRKLHIPTIYVNDNFGKWRSDFKKQVEHCMLHEVRGKALVEKLSPSEEDYFVLKPKHSGFYSTSLDILLDYLQPATLILTGITADICVYFTASDAYMRDYRLYIPSDCVACVEEEQCTFVLQQAERILKASIAPSDALPLEAIAKGKG